MKLARKHLLKCLTATEEEDFQENIDETHVKGVNKSKLKQSIIQLNSNQKPKRHDHTPVTNELTKNSSGDTNKRGMLR